MTFDKRLTSNTKGRYTYSKSSLIGSVFIMKVRKVFPHGVGKIFWV